MRFLLVLFLALVATFDLAAQPTTLTTSVGTMTATASALTYEIEGTPARVVPRDLLAAAPRRATYQFVADDVALLLDVAELEGSTWTPPVFADSTALDSLEAHIDQLEAALALAVENVEAAIAEAVAEATADLEAQLAAETQRAVAAEIRAETAEANYAAAMARVGVLDGRIRTFLVDLAPLLGQLRGLTIGPAETL